MEQALNPGLERAIGVAGGITAFARALKLSSHSVVQQWRINRVPAEHCPSIEGMTGVRCEELRPDVNWAVLRGAPVQEGGVAPGCGTSKEVTHG
ncbi:transcriptional regulator [Hydrogenophaga sp.]|uniref:transcriptional regulator n=1 Tax=Hydrogenophaga sp. TaxID=1904254 RepID=UPI00272425FA|nr:YdaS family helix-turn-helix protein [Caldisericota bacterium]